MRSPATMMSPERASPELRATVMLIVPLPRPLDVASAIQEAAELAVQLHCSWVRTSTCALPPAAPIGVPGDETWKRQAAACCVTPTWLSAMRSWALRVAGSGLDAMRKVTVLSPCPSAGEVISSQPAVDEADHWHSRAMETATEPLPPSGPKDREAESKLG